MTPVWGSVLKIGGPPGFWPGFLSTLTLLISVESGIKMPWLKVTTEEDRAEGKPDRPYASLMINL